MAMEKKTARAELKNREWVEFDIQLQGDVVSRIEYHACGCQNLLEAAEKASKTLRSKKLSQLSWPGNTHWDLLVSEAMDRLKGKFEIPYKEEELCHCRKIPTTIVDEAIVLGAQTPEKVTKWTTASSGCGTCRPNVQKIIDYRIKR
jgi:bacterioferritin-associated ferredoxin